MPVIFILGGKTRLARALYAASVEAGVTAKVLSGAAASRDALRTHYPDDAIVDGLQGAAMSPACLVVCAFGLVHPALPDFDTHLQAFAAEAQLLGDLVASHVGQISVVLVSTVIALMPSRDRAYYGGFKNLAEAAAAAAARRAPGAGFSVLYPGHLVERRGAGGLGSWLATPHKRLARRILQSPDATGSRVVGLDARLWLLANLLRGLRGVVFPTLGQPPLPSRDGLPRS